MLGDMSDNSTPPTKRKLQPTRDPLLDAGAAAVRTVLAAEWRAHRSFWLGILWVFGAGTILHAALTFYGTQNPIEAACVLLQDASAFGMVVALALAWLLRAAGALFAQSDAAMQRSARVCLKTLSRRSLIVFLLCAAVFACTFCF